MILSFSQIMTMKEDEEEEEGITTRGGLQCKYFPFGWKDQWEILGQIVFDVPKKMLNILMSSTIWLFVLFACMSLWRPTIHHQKSLFYSRVFSLVDEDHVKLLTVCFCTSIYVLNEFAREIANTSGTVLNNLGPFWYKLGN